MGWIGKLIVAVLLLSFPGTAVSKEKIQICGTGDSQELLRKLGGAFEKTVSDVSVPLQWQKTAPTRDAADRFFDQTVATRLAANDANDMLYQFEASRDNDPEPDLEKIVSPLLAINSADDQVNPPELGILEAQIKRVKKGRAVIIPISDKTRGHSTHSYPAVWGDELARLLRESELKP